MCRVMHTLKMKSGSGYDCKAVKRLLVLAVSLRRLVLTALLLGNERFSPIVLVLEPYPNISSRHAIGYPIIARHFDNVWRPSPVVIA